MTYIKHDHMLLFIIWTPEKNKISTFNVTLSPLIKLETK